jgi:hypothetical protein
MTAAKINNNVVGTVDGAAGRDRTCDQRVTAYQLNSFSP